MGMEIQWSEFNWLGMLGCLALGQAFLTVWFVALFARPWARAYGVDDPKAHTKAVPGYTYAIGAACVLLLSLGIETLILGLGVDSALGGMTLGAFIALHFSIASALPGYAFLKRYQAFWLAMGSQATLIVILSTFLALFH